MSAKKNHSQTSSNDNCKKYSPVKLKNVKCHRREVDEQNEDERQKKRGDQRIVDGHVKPIRIVGVFDIFA